MRFLSFSLLAEPAAESLLLCTGVDVSGKLRLSRKTSSGSRSAKLLGKPSPIQHRLRPTLGIKRAT